MWQIRGNRRRQRALRGGEDIRPQPGGGGASEHQTESLRLNVLVSGHFLTFARNWHDVIFKATLAESFHRRAERRGTDEQLRTLCTTGGDLNKLNIFKWQCCVGCVVLVRILSDQ